MLAPLFPLRCRAVRRAVAALALAALPISAHAQNFSSTGQSWSTSWGFSSASDRSIGLQQAQAIRSAQLPAGPGTVVNTTNFNTYDNRGNYMEIQGDTGEYIDFQLNGDRIGQNTNSIGAMNTGTTNIDITGNDNIVTATNAADSVGCVDGSIEEFGYNYADVLAQAELALGEVGLGGTSSCQE